MRLERYRDNSGNPRYKLDGKYVTATEATALLEWAGVDFLPIPGAVEIVRKDFPDRLAAIKKAEATMFSTFVIDHTVKIEDGIYAVNGKGATLKLYDDRIAIKKSNGVYDVYTLDICESRFIATLKTATLKALEDGEELSTIKITGSSGTVYTYDATTLEVIGTENVEVAETPEVTEETPVEKTAEVVAEKLVDFVINQRRNAQAEVEKEYREKQVA